MQGVCAAQTLDTPQGQAHVLSHRLVLVFGVQEGAWGRESSQGATLSATWEAMGCWWWP